MKTVLISIQPYYVFLIIAKAMGWDVPQEKTLELRKDFPKSPHWNKQVLIYCSKNKKSFNRIPKKYQALMWPMLGKVVAKFTCDEIGTYQYNEICITATGHMLQELSCLTGQDLLDYSNQKNLYAWQISNLRVFGTPMDLNEFYVERRDYDLETEIKKENLLSANQQYYKVVALTVPPQSWCYVESIKSIAG